MLEKKPSRLKRRKIKAPIHGVPFAANLAGRKQQTFASILPNLTTVGALCVGLSSFRFAYAGQWEWSITAILVAALLDAMDGRLARYLGSTSRFGAELDSLSDFVNFGVSPALMLYLFTMQNMGGLGWMICLFFAVCMLLRLARFNTLDIEGVVTSDWEKGFFTGVPAPAGAALALSPLMLYLGTSLDIFKSFLLNGVFLMIVGGLMISRIPTFSIKNIKISPKKVPLFMLIVTLVAAGIFSEPWVVLPMISVLYLITIPFSIRSHRRKKKNFVEVEESVVEQQQVE